MSDGQALLLVLCLIYLSDCLVWLRRQSLVFVQPWLRGWRIAAPSSYLGTVRGGLVFLNPLPPLGSLARVHLPPVALSPEGVVLLNPQRLAGQVPAGRGVFRPVAALAGATADGHLLWLRDGTRVACGSRRQAGQLAELLGELARAADEDARAARLNAFWTGTCDVRPLMDRPALRGLRLACNVLMVLLFVVAPLVAIHIQIGWVLLVTAPLMFALAAGIALAYRHRHKRLEPAARGERVAEMFKMVACPPTAIRACDLLDAPVSDGVHPVAAAHALLDPAAFREFAAPFFRDLHFPILSDVEPGAAQAVVHWHLAAQARVVGQYLAGKGVAVDSLLNPPGPADAAVSYCPRCLQQFAFLAPECPDCTGIGQRAFLR